MQSGGLINGVLADMPGAAVTAAAGQQGVGMSQSVPAAVSLPLSAAAHSESASGGGCGRDLAAAKQPGRGNGRKTICFPCCPGRRHR